MGEHVLEDVPLGLVLCEISPACESRCTPCTHLMDRSFSSSDRPYHASFRGDSSYALPGTVDCNIQRRNHQAIRSVGLMVSALDLTIQCAAKGIRGVVMVPLVLHIGVVCSLESFKASLCSCHCYFGDSYCDSPAQSNSARSGPQCDPTFAKRSPGWTELKRCLPRLTRNRPDSPYRPVDLRLARGGCGVDLGEMRSAQGRFAVAHPSSSRSRPGFDMGPIRADIRSVWGRSWFDLGPIWTGFRSNL